MRRAVASLLLVAAVTACGDADVTPPAAPPPVPTNGGPAADAEWFDFQWAGPRPWNGTVYAGTGELLNAPQPYPGRVLGPLGEFQLAGRPGEPYAIRTEVQLTDPERAMLWHVEVAGKFEPGKKITLRAPQRSLIHVESGKHVGPDEIVLFDEETGTSASALRDETKALFLCVWKGRDGNNYRLRAPARPWVCNEFQPGPCVVAARTRGRQWVVQRADLSPGAEIHLNVGAAPTGGGSVICEDENAVLLLHDDFPLPAPRVTNDLAFRATWNGVPPGKHVVRYPDGHEVDITVVEAAEVKLPDR